jgi:hypothetical protein
VYAPGQSPAGYAGALQPQTATGLPTAGISSSRAGWRFYSGQKFANHNGALSSQRAALTTGKIAKGEAMRLQSMRISAALVATLAATMVMAPAAEVGMQDLARYPDWNGQWQRSDRGNQWDNSKGKGPAQQAPLTAEYQALFEEGMAEQARGGQGLDPTFTCIPDGMPRAMNVLFGMEVIVLPKATYMLIEYLTMNRRIFTDGRKFPEDAEPSFMGYSIGNWVDQDGDGRYDVLEVETRNLKGPRTFDASGIPLHKDNKTVIKERIYGDKANPDVLHDEVTTFDNALTRPWTVTKNYRREPNPIFVEFVCPEHNEHVRIGDSEYMISADGHLMPAKKDQAPPDLRYFQPVRK